jgi:hypothetical protein
MFQLLPFLKVAASEPAYVDIVHSETLDWLNGGYPQYSATNERFLDHTFAVSGKKILLIFVCFHECEVNL